jgi:hypothetical protein
VGPWVGLDFLFCKEKTLATAGIRISDLPIRSVVTIPTMPSQLLLFRPVIIINTVPLTAHPHPVFFFSLFIFRLKCRVT